MNSANPFLTLKTRGLVPWMFGGFVAFVVLLGITAAIVPVDEKLSTNLVGLFMYAWMALWMLRKTRKNGVGLCRFFQRGGQFKIPGLVGLVVALLMFSIGAILVYYFLLSRISPRLLAWLTKPEPPPSSNRILAYFNLSVEAVTAIVLAPLLEELLFRGFLLNRWATKWGIRRAIFLSALVFGVLHVDLTGKFAFGVCMALLYLRTRALWAPIAAHALNNSVAVAIELLAGRGSDSKAPTVDSYRSFPWVGVFFVAIAAPFILAFIYRNWPGKNAGPPYVPESGTERDIVSIADSGLIELEQQPAEQ
jgi:membrane protease YdiL (CAAX protease family)